MRNKNSQNSSLKKILQGFLLISVAVLTMGAQFLPAEPFPIAFPFLSSPENTFTAQMLVKPEAPRAETKPLVNLWSEAIERAYLEERVFSRAA